MSQGMPFFEFNEDIIMIDFDAHSNSSADSLTTGNEDVSCLEFDNEMLDILWEEGQPAMHVFDPPPPLAYGTLESIVDQATHQPQPTVVENTDVEQHHHIGSNPGAFVSMAMDALLTCNNNNNNILNNEYLGNPSHKPDSFPWFTRAGSCSGVGDCLTRAGLGWSCKTNCVSATCCWGRDSRQLMLDSSTYNEMGLGGDGHTSTILASLGNNLSGGGHTITTSDAVHDQNNDQNMDEAGIVTEAVIVTKAVTKKRKRMADHNQSERKRRERINQRLHTLQKMVPNSTKTDKASMLDEVIEHLKQLHARDEGNVNMIRSLAMQQQQRLQMSMINIGIATASVPPAATTTDAFNPPPSAESDPLLAYLACLSQVQPMGTDAYRRLAAVYQQFEQSSGSASNN